MSKVSVIVPNYNHASYLEQRLNSIFNQTYQDFEVILLDDCSTDFSLHLLKDYSKHPKVTHFIINKINSGSPFQQWKKGIDLAKGDYVWIAESDDWADPKFLEMLLPLIEKDHIGIAYCNSNWVDDMGKIGLSRSHRTKNFEYKGVEFIKKELCCRCTIQNVSAVLWRRSVLDNCSDQFLRFQNCGDWMLYVEILFQSDIVFLAKKLNNFRWYHKSFSEQAKDKGTWIIEGSRILEVIGENLSLSSLETLKASKVWCKKMGGYFWRQRNWKRTYEGFYIIFVFLIRQLFLKSR